MQTNTIMLNTPSITKECNRISVKGSELSPQDSSRLRVEVPLGLFWLNTSMSKQPQTYINYAQIYQAYKEINNINMQDI